MIIVRDINRRINELRSRFLREPFVNTFGAHLERITYGHASISMVVEHNMVIIEQIANGGILATLGNSASVYAAMSSIPAGHTRALSLTIQFYKAAKEGDQITADAAVTNESRSYIWTSFDILNNRHENLASGIIQYTKPNK